MTAWLEPLRQTLDGSPTCREFFFRDDDGGWHDTALLRLVDCFDRARLPVDVALIPAATSAALARSLLARRRHGTAALGLHQHGLQHVNHETSGRKCEFGASRNMELQRADIANGRRQLEELLGDAHDPIFTPPWNRCTADTSAALHALGFRALSRDRTAATDTAAGLQQLNVAVDWMRFRRSNAPDASAVTAALRERLTHCAPVGIMLHHAVMTEADFELLAGLLGLLATHANARCHSMGQLLRASPIPPPLSAPGMPS